MLAGTRSHVTVLCGNDLCVAVALDRAARDAGIPTRITLPDKVARHNIKASPRV